MKTNNKGLAGLLAISCAMCIGCTVNRPRDSGVIQVDQTRGYTQVIRPYYKRKPNGFGHFTTVAFMGGGGYYGYEYYKPEAASNEKAMYAAAGAAGGFLVNKLFLAIGGAGKKTYLTDTSQVHKWLALYNKKKEKDWIFLTRPYATVDSILVMSRAVEPNFVPQNLNDVKNFADAFPQSQYLDKVIESIIPSLSKNDLAEMIALFPIQQSILKAKVEYVNRSQTETECLEAIKKYPDTKGFVEKKYASLVSTFPFAMDFIEKYPGSNSSSDIFGKLYEKITHQQLYTLLKAYTAINAGLSKKARTLYYERCSSLDGLREALTYFKDGGFAITANDNIETFDDAKTTFDKLDRYNPVSAGDSLEYVKEEIRYRFLIAEREGSKGSVENTRNLFMLSREEPWLKSPKTEPILNGIIQDYCLLLGEEFFTGKKVREQYDGPGTLYTAKGDVLTGSFSKGKLTGTGTILKKDGELLEGTFDNNELTGQGKITDPGGRVVDGEFVKGDLTGKGKITFSDGSFQTGNYKQFRLNGLGEWHFANGDSYKGEFDNGRYSGKGEYTWKEDGLRYEGRFEGGKRAGFGELYMPDGYQATAVWNSDCIDGDANISKAKVLGEDQAFSAVVTITSCEISNSTLPEELKGKLHKLLIKKIR